MTKQQLLKRVDTHALHAAFGLSVFAVMSSMILSNIAGLVPCDLCWYQRIFMFVLPIIFGVGLLRQDASARAYALPIIGVGAVLSLYHALLQWGIVTENVLECSASTTSCAEPEIQLLGFMTIPFGAFLAFCILGFLTYRMPKNDTKQRLSKKAQRQMGDILIISLVASGLFLLVLRALNIAA